MIGNIDMGKVGNKYDRIYGIKYIFQRKVNLVGSIEFAGPSSVQIELPIDM